MDEDLLCILLVLTLPGRNLGAGGFFTTEESDDLREVSFLVAANDLGGAVAFDLPLALLGERGSGRDVAPGERGGLLPTFLSLVEGERGGLLPLADS